MNVPITKETIKRLVNDIKQITKNPLTENGIYYQHMKNLGDLWL